MSWARLDDQANRHPKLLVLSDPAWRMWGSGLIYCQEELTDGFIPAHMIDTWGVKARDKKKVAAELCSKLVPGKDALWHKVAGGYRVHDYLDWNDSRETVLKKRANSKTRMERYRHQHDAGSNALCDALHNASHNASQASRDALHNALQASRDALHNASHNASQASRDALHNASQASRDALCNASQTHLPLLGVTRHHRGTYQIDTDQYGSTIPVPQEKLTKEYSADKTGAPLTPVEKSRPRAWTVYLAICHRVIEDYPNARDNWSYELKARMLNQGIDANDRGPKGDKLKLFERVLTACVEQHKFRKGDGGIPAWRYRHQRRQDEKRRWRAG